VFSLKKKSYSQLAFKATMSSIALKIVLLE